MKQEILFLGSGSAFVRSNENYQSNILINKKILFDCGTTINESLNNSNVKLTDIEDIIISHVHADHSHGLEYIGYSNYFINNKHETKLITSPYIANQLHEFLNITMRNTPDTNKKASQGYFNSIITEKYKNIEFIKTLQY